MAAMAEDEMGEPAQSSGPLAASSAATFKAVGNDDLCQSSPADYPGNPPAPLQRAVNSAVLHRVGVPHQDPGHVVTIRQDG